MRSDKESHFRPIPVLVVGTILGTGAFFDLIYFGPGSIYAVISWVVVVPLIFVATINGVPSQRWFRFLVALSLPVIGLLRYLDGEWRFLTIAFVTGGFIELFRLQRTR